MSLRLILIHFIYRFVFGVGIAAIMWVGGQFVFAKAYQHHAVSNVLSPPQTPLQNGRLVTELPRPLKTAPLRSSVENFDGGTVVGPFDHFFHDFRELRVGDTIRFSTPGGTFGYFVTTLEIIDSTERRIQESPGHSELTIIASRPSPFAGAVPQQFVVHARPQSTAEELELHSQQN
ncbi:MAG TPA: hypothetical protein VFO86_01695 [Terriglobia bacterium]|nr:hypothetical protein [Terriglobia bacterium]